MNKRIIAGVVSALAGAAGLSAFLYYEIKFNPYGKLLKKMGYKTSKAVMHYENTALKVCNTIAGETESWKKSDGELLENQSYGNRNRQKYDLYIPEGIDKEKPQKLILFIHGGTWIIGDKELLSWECAKYAKKGYITATMNYNLSSEGNERLALATGSKNNANMYDMLDDITLALTAIKEQCGKMGIEFDALALSGVSAGSHLSMMYACTRIDESPIKLKTIFPLVGPVGFLSGTFNNLPDDIVAQYASIVAGQEISEKDIANPDKAAKKLIASISPVSQITKDTIPMFFGYAGRDATIGTNHYETIRPVLEKHNVVHDVVMIENANHGLMGDEEGMKVFFEKSLEWLEKYM